MERHEILIVDDHPVVRKALSLLLVREPGVEICGEAEDIATAVEQLKAHRPRMVVLDISLKDSHGMELLAWIKDHDPDVKVLVWSMYDEKLYAERVLRAGAQGYINKQEPVENVIAAIRHVLGGGIYTSPRMTSHLLKQVGTGVPLSENPVDALSNRELEVFGMLGQGMTTQQIAHKTHLSHKTIETYREKIKGKLGLANSAELIQRAVQWVMENG